MLSADLQTLIYRTAGIWPNANVFRGLVALALVTLAVQIGANLFVQRASAAHRTR